VSEPAVHREPFVHLVDLSSDRALIAWGAFTFTRSSPDARWEIVDDQQLYEIAGRRTCIGAGAEPFGAATVQVFDEDGHVATEVTTSDRTWVWVHGLHPDTEYHYRITVDGTEWAAGERWDYVPADRGGYDLMPAGRSYDLRFRTWPDPDAETPDVRFVAMGDYGVGTRADSESSRRQRRIAEVLDRLVFEDQVRFIVSLGDNIYRGEGGYVEVDAEGGAEDDDWYSSFFQPYRYVLARVPFFPAIGNHDTADATHPEGSDDRAQLEDNYHLRQRFVDEPDRSSSREPGLFYRLRYGRDLELVCIDTSHDNEDQGIDRYFQAPEHQAWLNETFGPRGVRWLIPFSHHSMYCAGPEHHNDADMQALLPLFDRAGVRLVLAGHEHNFQLNEVDGRTFIVSGAGAKLREELPDGFADAGTKGWCAQAHLLLVDVRGDTVAVTPVSALRPDRSLHVMSVVSPRNDILDPPFVCRAT
jgi:hypothetical protein